MPTVPALDLNVLLKDIPRGAWVAIAADQTRVIAFGSDAKNVLEKARKTGETDPIITRVPEASCGLVL